MARPTSFRLPEELLERLDAEASGSGTSATALVTSLLDEGLKTRQFPGIVYRSGSAGRRAALAGGPDVWEVVRTLRSTSGKGDERIRRVAAGSELTPDQVRLSVDFYTAFPDEIDARIAADAEAAERIREMIERRERLLSS